MWLPPPNIGLLKNVARYWQHFFREIAWIWLCENFPHGIDLILSAQGLTCVCMCTMPMQASEAALIYWKSSFTRESRSQNFHPYFKTFFTDWNYFGRSGHHPTIPSSPNAQIPDNNNILFIYSKIQSPKSGNNFIVPLDLSSPGLVISRRSS